MSMWISDELHYSFMLLIELGLLCIAILIIITLSDLECDFLNPTTCCRRLNQWVVPELAAASAMSLCNLFNLHLVYFFITLPFTTWLGKRYLLKPPGRIGVFDPLEIHNRHQLRGHMREAMAKLGYHLVMLVMYLYSAVYAIMTTEEED